jgi:hypothetical protein
LIRHVRGANCRAQRNAEVMPARWSQSNVSLRLERMFATVLLAAAVLGLCSGRDIDLPDAALR